jgi:hypothetical protein
MYAIGRNAFEGCISLTSFYSDYVYYLDRYAFSGCTMLQSVTLSKTISYAAFEQYAFQSCRNLVSLEVGAKTFSMYSYCFQGCESLTSFTFRGVNSISDHFRECTGMAYLDFTNYTSVPTLGKATYITNINSDCKILVPASLYDEWIAATNWSDVADRIVAV